MCRQHVPSIVIDGIRRVGCVKIYERSIMHIPSFIQWNDNRSYLTWQPAGSKGQHIDALFQEVKSQLQQDFQHQYDAYGDDDAWQSEILLSAIYAQLESLFVVLRQRYVILDAWKAWSRLPAWGSGESIQRNQTRLATSLTDKPLANVKAEAHRSSNPIDALETLKELQNSRVSIRGIFGYSKILGLNNCSICCLCGTIHFPCPLSLSEGKKALIIAYQGHLTT